MLKYYHLRRELQFNSNFFCLHFNDFRSDKGDAILTFCIQLNVSVTENLHIYITFICFFWKIIIHAKDCCVEDVAGPKFIVKIISVSVSSCQKEPLQLNEKQIQFKISFLQISSKPIISKIGTNFSKRLPSLGIKLCKISGQNISTE